MKRNKTYIAAVLAAVAFVIFWSPWSTDHSGWSAEEKTIIEQSDSVMRVLTVDADSTFLRAPSSDLSAEELKSLQLETLMRKMLRTVTDPSQDGVGIAAPQVGIHRRLVCVQRFDKEGEPFECYPNIHIEELYGEVKCGPEGCLSVPGKRGMVPRYEGVCISYVSPLTGEKVNERIEGFTAVIFQHECDHLDGILYTDRADSVYDTKKLSTDNE